uniref:DUF3615 domain-containing protein n=1 Tax=Aegilops tauschii TaxID=37682 RepID=M8CUY9_AEGTA
MASKALLPRECLPRRSPGGGAEPITVYVRVDEEGNYHPRYFSAKIGRVFRDLQDLEQAVRTFYTSIYIARRLLKRPLDPPPSPTDDIFQFEFVVEPAADVSSLKASTALEEKSSGSDKVPDEKPAEVSSLKDSLKATTLEEKSSSSSSSGQQPDQDTVMASPPSGNCLASPSGPGIWQRERQDWGFGYYIRDLAYELKDVLHGKTICEGRTTCYYHLNFTVAKGAGDSNSGIENLFFAEVKCVLQGKEEELSVTCFCPVESTDDGYCYGCTMDRDVNMKHPISASAYLAGQVKMEAKKEKDVADKTCMKMFTQPPTMRAFDADNMTFDDADD